MADHQPAVIWCPNCGDALTVPIVIHTVNQHGDAQLKVQFAIQYVQHRCPER